MRLYWCGSTRFHDWSGANRKQVRELVSTARAAELLGSASWYAAAPQNKQRDVKSDDKVLEDLLSRKASRQGNYGFNVGGTEPTTWELAVNLFGFIEEDQQVRGINMLHLWFESDRFKRASGTESLVSAFRAMHRRDNTEVAYVHPYVPWVNLTDFATDGAYEKPLTFGPMFPGIMWINFIGKRHLDLFDRKKLRRLSAHQVEWLGDDGLFIRVCETPAKAETRAIEKEMIRLTDAFRQARL